MNREILIKWIDQAIAMNPGESIFLPGENRDYAKSLARKFRNELKIVSELDPVRANKIQVHTTVKETLYWVELKRTFGNPLVGFKKGKDGETVKITIEDPEKKRRLLLMKEDGLTLDEVEEIEGQLSEEERSIFDG